MNSEFRIQNSEFHRMEGHSAAMRVYTCECIDRHKWTNCFCLVTLAGETYLCFRKTLYGFTLLHMETFAETDYFPEKVLQGEESFIMADVLSADDLLFFYGCYWGCPYFYIIYDPASGRFLELYSLYPMEYENTLIVQEGTVHLQGKDQGRQEINVSLTIQEIKDLLRKKGTEDM